MAVAVMGTINAVYRAARLPPAQAMQPELPTKFHTTLVERLGLKRWLSQPTRMILRHVERRPLKSLMTTLGIAMACGIMMVSGFQEGAINYMIEVQYGMSQREDMMAIYTEPTSKRSLYSLQSIQGVEHVEGFRVVPAILKFEHHLYRTAVHGIEPNGSLMRLLDTDLNIIELPEDGIILTDYLAELLHINTGDLLTIEVQEGQRSTVQVVVVGTAKQYLGVNGYMRIDSLNALLKEGHALTGALLKVDERYQRDIYAELKEIPRVAGVVEHKSAIKSFYDTIAETILFFTFITTLLGSSIAFGVIYNTMRIALSERNRELASLRVLGFERNEVGYILLGEMALFTFIAIPLGFLIGYGLCAYMASQFDSDLYRVPLVLGMNVYAFSALVVLLSSIASAIMIWRNLADLDMVAVLKSKE
jgi:putative ABC transport system permease protein